ncbi:MAG: hypothetical protein QUS14_02795 [Pyrinomonadaceae bacterium]|nr:hypothetical protein [Pyrinomonadaceae bacterium]
MTNENLAEKSYVPLKDRLGFKLAALFVLVFLIAFFGLWTYGVAQSYMESRAAEESPALQPKPIVIDPRIQSDLTKVLALDSEPLPPDVRDPFNDRTGISGLVPASMTTGTVSVSGGTASTGGGSTQTSVQTIRGSGVQATAGSTPAEPQLSAVEATKQRFAAWEERARVGIDVELDPRVFAIEDLLPVGLVDGGDGVQEVLFFSEAANRTVSFPVGTMFYDGWLTELRSEGVVFSFNDERRTVRMRSWGRSIRASS